MVYIQLHIYTIKGCKISNFLEKVKRIHLLVMNYDAARGWGVVGYCTLKRNTTKFILTCLILSIYLALVTFSVTFSSSKALRPFLGEEEVDEEELAWWGDKDRVVFQFRNLTFDTLINMKEESSY
jgi:hypothetical protein